MIQGYSETMFSISHLNDVKTMLLPELAQLR